MKIEKIPEKTLILGLFLLILAKMVPYNGFEKLLGALRPVGFITIYVNPILGLIGSVISIYKKRWILLILNIIQIFSFFIIMGLG